MTLKTSKLLWSSFYFQGLNQVTKQCSSKGITGSDCVSCCVFKHFWFWLVILSPWSYCGHWFWSFWFDRRLFLSLMTVNNNTKRISHIDAAPLWAWLKSSFFVFFSVALCPINPPLPPLLDPPPPLRPSLQVSQHSGFSYLGLGWPGSGEEQEQVCSLQRLRAHLAAQGTEKKITN